MCEDARSKFTEAETRLKKKDVKFFESVTSLEKAHKKSSDRLKACQKRTTVARNDYILCLSTTNAHLQKHAAKSFPQIMLVSRNTRRHNNIIITVCLCVEMVVITTRIIIDPLPIMHKHLYAIVHCAILV